MAVPGVHLCRRVLAFTCLSFLAAISQGRAQVTLDGSLGPAGPLAGPAYEIGADLGQQVGTNLFHSFGAFNIHQGESATFTGPEGLDHLINRVTGGASSSIDGLLRSTVPGADFWFLNPAGVLFGPNAKLDVPGSFHVSTADALRLADGAVFGATNPTGSLLTTASPAAFGFFTEQPAGLSLERGHLRVLEGETLSMVGGDIEIKEGTLHAPGGRINLAALASSGEVVPTDSDLAMQEFKALGAIDITHGTTERPEDNGRLVANVDASGAGGGAMFIRGRRFTAENGWVFADTLGEQAGQGVDVAVEVEVALENGARIAADTLAAGQGGDLHIQAYNLNVRDGSAISASTFGAGQGGNLIVQAESIVLSGDGAGGFVTPC